MKKRFYQLSGLLTFCVIMLSHSYAQVDYASKVEPLWSKYNCTSCHGGSGGLFIDSYNSLMTSGDHKPVVVAFDTNSVLVKKLRGTTSFGSRMPFGGPYLPNSDMQTIIQWIKEGAKQKNTTNIAAGNNLPERISLKQNYPNPFNPSTTIEFDLPNPSAVSLKVYDYLGEQITDLVDEILPAGIYKNEWNGKDKPSGVYYLVLKTGSFTQMIKMVLMK